MKIVDATPPARFAFTTVAGPFKFGTWSYDIEPTAVGCKVTESWVDQRNAVFSKPFLGKAITGVADRATHNKASMETTRELEEGCGGRSVMAPDVPGQCRPHRPVRLGLRHRADRVG